MDEDTVQLTLENLQNRTLERKNLLSARNTQNQSAAAAAKSKDGKKHLTRPRPISCLGLGVTLKEGSISGAFHGAAPQSRYDPGREVKAPATSVPMPYMPPPPHHRPSSQAQQSSSMGRSTPPPPAAPSRAPPPPPPYSEVKRGKAVYGDQEGAKQLKRRSIAVVETTSSNWTNDFYRRLPNSVTGTPRTLRCQLERVRRRPVSPPPPYEDDRAGHLTVSTPLLPPPRPAAAAVANIKSSSRRTTRRARTTTWHGANEPSLFLLPQEREMQAWAPIWANNDQKGVSVAVEDQSKITIRRESATDRHSLSSSSMLRSIGVWAGIVNNKRQQSSSKMQLQQQNSVLLRDDQESMSLLPSSAMFDENQNNSEFSVLKQQQPSAGTSKQAAAILGALSSFNKKDRTAGAGCYINPMFSNAATSYSEPNSPKFTMTSSSRVVTNKRHNDSSDGKKYDLISSKVDYRKSMAIKIADGL